MSLKKGEIFVFGSNLAGHHMGGAAKAAHKKFGAEWGVGVGLTGRSYAIPTMQGGVETIRPYVNQFINFASRNPDMKFLVTRIGCGIAGFKDEEMAPLFRKAVPVSNIYHIATMPLSVPRKILTSYSVLVNIVAHKSARL